MPKTSSKPFTKYQTGVKKTREPGSRQKRAAPRNNNKWRWPYVDTGLHWGSWLLTPPAQSRPPPHSANLGRLIDGGLCWAGNTLGSAPLVGGFLGWCCKGVTFGVRKLEDGINSLTGRLGFHLFLLVLLHVLAPCSAKLVQDGNRTMLTNCCSPDDIFWCTNQTCVHKAGCIPCVGEECWVPATPLVSHPEGYDGGDPLVTQHLDLFSAIALACDVFEVQEQCAAAAWFLDWAVTDWRVHPDLNITGTCYLVVKSSADPLALAWFKSLGQSLSVTELVRFAVKLPRAIIAAAQGQHFATILFIVYSFVTGSHARAIAGLLLYAEAANAASWGPCWEPPYPLCPARTETKGVVQCFDPWPYEPTVLQINTSTRAYYPYSGRVGRSCLQISGYRVTCCRTTQVDPFCGDCQWDCTWRDPTLRWERCWTGPFLTEGVTVRGVVRPVAIPKFMDAKRVFPGENWVEDYAIMDQKYFHFFYDAANISHLPASDWIRLPVTPRVTRGAWMVVPNGFYADKFDISTGLISKTTTGHQLIYSGMGDYALTTLSHKVIVLCLLVLLGSRYVFVIAAIFLLASSVYAQDVEVAILAAAGYPWWLAWLAFILAFRLGVPWGAVLIRNPFWAILLFLYLRMGLASALPLGVPTEAVASFFAPLLIWLWACLMLGVLDRFFPHACLIISYCKWRLQLLIYWFAGTNPVGVGILVLLFPQAAALITCYFLACVTFLASLNSTLYAMTGGVTRAQWENALRFVGKLWGPVARWLQGWILLVAGERGVFWFSHLGQVPPVRRDLKVVSIEPYACYKSQILVARDRGRTLACGDAYRGHPVVARCRDLVMAGIGTVPEGWQLTAPFTLQKVQELGDLRAISVVITGYDDTPWGGSVYQMGTLTRGWMGFTCNGLLHTCQHGPRGRRLATPKGPLHPLAVDDEADYALYEAPAGSESLEVCRCPQTEGWLAARTGEVVPLRPSPEPEIWTTQSVFPLSIAKGSSGAPVLCKQGHVIGMFVSAFTARGSVSRVRVKPVKVTCQGSVTPAMGSLTAPPPVPKKQEIRMLEAPTGSGKSTKLPMHYVSQGHTVLVLNPSVATTLSFEKYMHDEYGTTPNIKAADYTRVTGSKLTYSTYGRFLGGNTNNITQDVIICDECHSTDATTVLGIGQLLMAAPTLKAKLIILATATPPGTPVTPHPNITEEALTTEGDIDFHGKKLPVARYSSGRHLIFQPTKNQCEALAAEFNKRGIRAVFYYRGMSVTSIPREGNVVVVATDALMTGYTGNFDTVTDSNMAISPTFEIDMAPTITLGLQVAPTTSVARMQRRGRTGRGSPGRYYYVTEECLITGVVPDATVVECFDSGIVWFGMHSSDVLAALDVYRGTPGLPAISLNLEEMHQFFSMLGWVSAGHVAQAKQVADNYVLLTAAQRQMCAENRWAAPDDNPRWRRMRKFKDPCKKLFHLDGYCDNDAGEPEMAERMRAAFAEHETSGITAVIGLGFGVATTFLAIDSFGACCVRRAWRPVTGNVTTAAASDPASDVFEEEECSRVALFDSMIVEISDKIRTAAEALATRLRGGTPPVVAAVGETGVAALGTLADNLPMVMGVVQYAAGLLTLPENPAMASTMSFFGSALIPLSLSTKVFLSVLGGVFASKLSTHKGTLLFVGTSVLGAAFGAWSWSSFLVHIFGGYAAATSVALVVFKALCLELPTPDELAGLLNIFLCPGAAVAGVAGAVAIYALTTPGADKWPNRLLAMLARGQVLPDGYFLEARNLRKEIVGLLQDLQPWQLLMKAVKWVNTPSEEECASFRGAILDCWHFLGRIFRHILEGARGVIARCASIPGVPWYSCQKGYNGAWAGDGVIHAKCGCGAELSYVVEYGSAKLVSGKRLCRCYWSGVPVNNKLIGNARPLPTVWRTMVVHVGFDSYIKYEKRESDVYVTATSGPDITIPKLVPHVTTACMVDGVQVDPFSGTPTTEWTSTALVRDEQWSRPLQEETDVTGRNRGTTRVHLPYLVTQATEKSAYAKKRVSPADIRPDMQPTVEVPSEPPATLPKKTPATLTPAKGKAASLVDVPLVETQVVVHQPKLPHSPASCCLEAAGPGGTECPNCKAEIGPEGGLCCKVASEKKGLQNLETFRELEKSREKLRTIEKGEPLETTSSLEGFRMRRLRRGSGPAAATSDLTDSAKTAEEQCSKSYIWSGAFISSQRRRIVSATRVVTTGLMRVRNLVYATDPAAAEQRAKKVTVDREPIFGDAYEKFHKLACDRARAIKTRMWDWRDVAEHTPRKSARSAVSGITGGSIRDQDPSAIKLCQNVLDEVMLGHIPERMREVTIMPKSEVFVKTPAKPTAKPPRLIAYPHLEMRCVEKVVYGDLAPSVVKAVCGDAYGFLYSPAQRVQQLLKMWREKKSPAGFTCDTVCFDSTITPDDIRRETQIYSQAQMSEDQRRAVWTIANQLYAGGPMVSTDGRFLGTRNCRASGVYTTSSSNTMTCWLKVNAAAHEVGFIKPSFLICGDDCVCIFESQGHDRDTAMCSAFAAAMKRMGAPQGEVPKPRYSLEELEACSSNVECAQTKDGEKVYYLTRDPRIPLGRCAAEGEGFNPTGAWLGFLVNNYPTLWASRVLAVHLISILLADPQKTITFDWYGKNWTLPVMELPYLLEAIHGPKACRLTLYSPREVTRVGAALKDLTMRPLRWWKRRARELRVICVRKGGKWAELANRLLWFTNPAKQPPLDPKVVSKYLTFEYWNPNADPEDAIGTDPRIKFRYKLANWLIAIGLAVGLWFFSLRA
nr:polyprotein [Bat hepacivirus]